MNKRRFSWSVILLCCVLSYASLYAETMSFDPTAWETGHMNQQYPSDSNGAAGNCGLDYFYYYERMPIRMPDLDDSLGSGSPSRTYDSAVLSLVVAYSGLSGSDSMRIFGKRLTHDWAEDGVSWTYFRAAADSAWNTAGGDVNSLPCTDTVIVDATVVIYDTLRFYLDTAFIRNMVEADDYGWLMIAENIVDRGVFQVHTEDIGVPEYCPTLTVYYTEGAQQVVFSGRRRSMP